MGFADEFKALEGLGKDLEQVVEAQGARLKEWLVDHPMSVFAELRTWHPNLMTPGFLLVTRYQDVAQVLDDDDTFSVAPYGESTMRNNEGPNFALGMDRCPQYVHDISILRLAVRWEDVDTIRAAVTTDAQALIAAAPNGTLEMANGYGRLLAAEFSGSYFGTPGPDTPTLFQWTRAVFEDIFFNFTHDAQMSANGIQASRALNAYLDGLIAAAHQSADPPADTVLGRLVALQCTRRQR